ncbi:MAG: hypothetical protein LBS77_07275 [Desulfovibrio sp.]|jgi:hypothetical protein|nr:hypothetical protein [Desulfovibrio sp.]
MLENDTLDSLFAASATDGDNIPILNLKIIGDTAKLLDCFYDPEVNVGLAANASSNVGVTMGQPGVDSATYDVSQLDEDDYLRGEEAAGIVQGCRTLRKRQIL